MKNIYIKLSVASEILLLCLFVYCVIAFREQSGSVIFHIWGTGPLLLLLLSHGSYFAQKWIYTVPVAALGLLVMWAVNGFDPVLGMILLLAVLFYGALCFIHQQARSGRRAYSADA